MTRSRTPAWKLEIQNYGTGERGTQAAMNRIAAVFRESDIHPATGMVLQKHRNEPRAWGCAGASVRTSNSPVLDEAPRLARRYPGERIYTTHVPRTYINLAWIFARLCIPRIPAF